MYATKMFNAKGTLDALNFGKNMRFFHSLAEVKLTGSISELNFAHLRFNNNWVPPRAFENAHDSAQAAEPHFPTRITGSDQQFVTPGSSDESMKFRNMKSRPSSVFLGVCLGRAGGEGFNWTQREAGVMPIQCHALHCCDLTKAVG